MTRPGTGAGSGTRELFQLGVEGGEFVRHLGVAHGFDPLLGKLLGKPDASIAPFEACIFLGRQHHEFIAAVRGGDRHGLAAGAGRQGSKALLQLGFGHADHFHANSVIHSETTPNPVPKQLYSAAERGRDMRQKHCRGWRRSMCSITRSTISGSAPHRKIWTRSRTGPTAPPGEYTRVPGLGPRTSMYSILTTAMHPWRSSSWRPSSGTASNAAMLSRSTPAISGSRGRTRSLRAAAIWGAGASARPCIPTASSSSAARPAHGRSGFGRRPRQPHSPRPPSAAGLIFANTQT